MIRRLSVFITLLLVSFAAFAAHVSEKDKINYLLNLLATADVTFLRNGEEWPGEKAKEHLQGKLHSAGDRIQTADDFISQVASKSLSSGQAYHIRMSDGSIVTSEKWLRKNLSEMKPK
jgi:hypothetical protein